MANHQALLALADYIENNDCMLFNMDVLLSSVDTGSFSKREMLERWGLHDAELVPHFCGSVGCLAGFKWMQDKGEVGNGRYNADDYARDALGLTHRQAEWLFYPRIEVNDEDDDGGIEDEPTKRLRFRHITRAQSLRVLRTFAEAVKADPTALPDWTEVARENGDI